MMNRLSPICILLTLAWVFTGCTGDMQLGATDKDVNSDDTVGDAPASGFSWVIEGKLAGMARPGSREPLDEDLDALQELGIKLLVSLTESPPMTEDQLQQRGIELLSLPVADFTAPTQAQLVTYNEHAQAAVDSGRPVCVHCGAGMGRTGTFLAAHFVNDGMTAENAILEIRRLRPGSIETAAQEKAIWDYALSIHRAPREPIFQEDQP